MAGTGVAPRRGDDCGDGRAEQSTARGRYVSARDRVRPGIQVSLVRKALHGELSAVSRVAESARCCDRNQAQRIVRVRRPGPACRARNAVRAAHLIHSQRSAAGRLSVSPVTTCWTALRVAAHLLGGLAESFWVPRLSKQHRDERIQLWSRRMLTALRVQVRVVGSPQTTGPTLLVSNHISWLDILALHATCHCRFIAKASVGRWPLIGRLATAAGTFYVDRAS